MKREKNKQEDTAQATIVTTAMMLLFKILGFIKQSVIAFIFGATGLTDVYFMSSEFVTGLSEAIVNAFGVPALSLYSQEKRKGKENRENVTNGILEALLIFSTLIVALFIIFAKQISYLIAPGYDEVQKKELVLYIRLLAPLFYLCSMQTIYSAILDSEKEFTIPRLQSGINSIAIILCCVLLSIRLSTYSLVLGQYLSAILFLFLLCMNVHKYVGFRFVKLHGNKKIKKIFMLAVPLIIGNGVMQINQIVDKTICSNLGEGSVSAISYSHVLTQFVTSILIVNVGNIMYANFSDLVIEGKTDAINNYLSRTLDSLVIVLMPISIVAFTCSREIVEIVYLRGNFTITAVEQTSIALKGYSIAFVAQGIRDILRKSMYAYQDTKTPVINSSLSVIINVILSIILAQRLGILGIALGTSISAFVTMGMNIVAFKKKTKFRFYKLNHTLVKCVLPCICSIIAVFFLKYLTDNRYTVFILSSIVSGICFIAILYVLDVEEIRIFVKRMFNRIH